MSFLHLYRRPALSEAKKNELLSVSRQKASPDIADIETEYCFNIETTDSLANEDTNILRWLLAETFDPANISDKSFLTQHSALGTLF